MRKKIDYRSGSRETYSKFCIKYPELNISYNEWLEIIYAFNEEFRNYILETGSREKLPLGLGSFSINKKKRKTKKVTPDGKEFMNLPIDWKKTSEKGKIIYNFNYHTEGYFFGWLWFKADARVKNSMLWSFKASRVTSRMLAHYLKNDNKYQHIYRQWRV
jgi:hypothetical protein